MSSNASTSRASPARCKPFATAAGSAPVRRPGVGKPGSRCPGCPCDWQSSFGILSAEAMPRRHSGKSTQASQRQLRVAELVRHALAELLTRGAIHDAVLASHPLTIPEVRMSPDLRLATIFVLPLGGNDTEAVLAALQSHKRYIR